MSALDKATPEEWNRSARKVKKRMFVPSVQLDREEDGIFDWENNVYADHEKHRAEWLQFKMTELQSDKKVSDGSSADYYQLPYGSTELQDLISCKDMNAQIGEIFRECFRYGEAAHSTKIRGAKKIKFYIEAELKRLGITDERDVTIDRLEGEVYALEETISGLTNK